MPRSILMYERYYHEGEARQYHLQYYLLIDQVTFGCNSLDIYGAKVLAFCNGEYLDQKVIRGITPFGPRITAIVNRLADSLATPKTMERMVLSLPPA